MEFVQLLLERGAEIEARDINNKTPLHYAADNNSTESPQLLLKRSGDIEAMGYNNKRPLHYTAENNR